MELPCKVAVLSVIFKEMSKVWIAKRFREKERKVALNVTKNKKKVYDFKF